MDAHGLELGGEQSAERGSRLRAFVELFERADRPALLVERGTVQRVNRAFELAFGYRPAEGSQLSDLLAAEPGSAVSALWSSDGSETAPRRGWRGVWSASAPVWLQIDSVRIGGDGYGAILLLQRDDASEGPPSSIHGDDLYEAFFEVNTAVKLLIDPESGQIVDANGAARRFYGWPLEAMRSMKITDINTLSADEVKAELAAAAARRRSYFRFKHRTSSGAIKSVEVYSGPVVIRRRKLLFSVIHDVTEREALQDQLAASQRLEAVGRLAGGIAHEFNNLVTVMLNSATMLLRSVPDESPMRRRLHDVHYVSERAADLTRELLAFSRRQVMKPQELELNAIVTQLTGVLQRSLGSVVTIRTELGAGMRDARLDPRQLEHVIMNLVLNARDAMPDGGTIVIATSEVDVGEGETAPPGPWLLLRVSDEGEGMDEETRLRIFEPYFTTKPAGVGTGLGMATVYGIVRQSGGHIDVRSAPGEGTQMLIYLPIADAQGERKATSEDAARTSCRVLLVDDMDQVRESLGSGLSGLGYEVALAGSVEQALRRFDEGELDVVVTDIRLRRENGLALAKALWQTRPELPVVFISGDLHDVEIDSLPPDAVVLQKPLGADMLARSIDELLAKRG